MRARLAASAVLVALVVVVTTGCTFMTPQATTDHYDPSDGFSTSLGDVQVNNALLVTDNGTTASLVIALHNSSNYGVQVSIQYENAKKQKVNDSIFVNAESVSSIGGENSKKVVLTGIDAPAGSLFPVFLQYGDVTGKQLWIPVLAPNAEYAKLAPTVAPTAAP